MSVNYGFYPTNQDAYEFHAVNNPFIELTVNSRNVEDMIYDNLSTWNGDVTQNTITYDYSTFRGLNSGSANPTLHLTKTVDFYEKGYYLIQLRIRKHPLDSGSITLSIDGNTIGEELITAEKNEHTETIQFPITLFRAGSHDFDITINKQAYVHELFIYPITKYVYSNQKGSINKYVNEIDCLNINFTENGVTENNILSADIPLSDELFNTYNKSNLFTDFKDHVTLSLGHNYRDAVYKFGGYTLNPQMSDDKITLRAMDRFLDFIVQPIDKKFAIGKPPETDFTVYGSVWELGSYLAGILEYPIIVDDEYFTYGLALDYADVTSYNDVTVSNLQKTQDTDKENSLFLYSGTSTGAASSVLWSSGTPVDVTTNPLFFMRYSCYDMNDLPINVIVDMYKDSETSGDAVSYEIIFLGPDDGTITNAGTAGNKTDNSGWSGLIFNLYNAFKALFPSATNFYVNKVQTKCTVSSTMASNPTDYGIWIKSLQFYPTTSAAPKLSFDDATNCYEAEQKLCSSSNHVAFIIPGEHRAEDRFLLMPADYAESPVELHENTNIIKVNDWSYDPLSDGLCNHRTAYYTATSDGPKYYVHNEDNDSIRRYGRVKSQIEYLNGITTSAEAQASVNTHITENKIKDAGIGFMVHGNVLFNPSQYVLAEMNSKRLNDNYRIMSIEHELDLIENTYYSLIDVNRLPAWLQNRVNERQVRTLYNSSYIRMY
jgi:hypothetical protein